MIKRVLISAIVCFVIAIPAAAGAQAPTGDYASGFGFWEGDTEGEFGPGSVGFEAIGTLPSTGLAQGEFDYRAGNRGGQGRGFHADVLCIEVDGDMGFVGVQVEQSTDPAVAPGDLLIATVIDGGDGQGDMFDLDVAEPGEVLPPMNCEDGDPAPNDIRGNIYVADNGGFARN